MHWDSKKWFIVYLKKGPERDHSSTFSLHKGWLYMRGVYSIQHYVITFFSDLWQVGGFLRVLQFPPPIKLTATI
jgi:hypothetical protein